MAWLVAIGLTNALLATLLAAAALLAKWLRRPALAHALWVLVLCKLLTPPLVRVSLPGWDKPGGWLDPASWTSAPNETARVAAELPARHTLPAADVQLAPGATNGPAIPSTVTVPARAATPAAAQAVSVTPVRPSWKISLVDCVRAAAVIWVVGSVITLFMLCRRAWRFRAFLRQAATPDDRLNERVARLARSAGIASPPEVIIVESVVSPMLWGVGRGARLLLPGPLARRLDSAACDALVLHELAHYARGDCWVRLLELAVQVIYWWHPLVGWARRAIEAAEEECCDAWVLQHQSGTRRSYAEALLATIDFLCEPADSPSPLALPPVASGLGDVPMLRCRLTQIMCGDVAVRPSRAVRMVVLAFAVVVLPLGPTFFGAGPKAASARSTSTDLKTVPPPATVPTKADGEIRGANFPGRPVLNDLGRPSYDEPRDSAQPVNSTSAISSPAARLAVSQVPRLPAVLWATATSLNGKYKVEARAGRRTTLVHVESGWRLDLSTYKIACLAFTPDSRTMATGHDDSIVRIWDCETGGVLYSLKGSEGPITSLSIDAQGRRLAAGAADGSVLVWDLSGGEQIARLARQDVSLSSLRESPAGPGFDFDPRGDVAVSCVRWSHAGDRLAVSVGRWSDREQASLLIWSPEEGRAWSYALGEPAGALEWLADDRSLLLAGWDGRGRIWRLADEAPSGWLALPKDTVSAAAWSPDCRLVSSWQSEQFASGAENELDHRME